MATPTKLKMKKSTKKVVKTEINEGTYVDTQVVNTKSGGKGGDGAGWRPRPENATQSPEGQNVKYQPPRGGGKSSISELPGQYTKPIPVPVKPKSPAPGKSKPTMKGK